MGGVAGGSAPTDHPPAPPAGGALAHAFLPRRGEAHFDRDERWSLTRRRGRNLFVVLAHEIGHTLGLPHSPAPRALMAPYYKRLGRDALLSWDDVLAVQGLYGEPPPCPPPVPRSSPGARTPPRAPLTSKKAPRAWPLHPNQVPRTALPGAPFPSSAQPQSRPRQFLSHRCPITQTQCPIPPLPPSQPTFLLLLPSSSLPPP